MSLNEATLTQAKRALRAYGATGQPTARAEAHGALSDLLSSARSDGDRLAEDLVQQAQGMLSSSPAAANAADNLLDRLAGR